ncbi:MAG: putative DNA binding domain-containing protein [Paludibacteraceae bacterium]|nr:putative DNA binding domain-containing protein [Paludibacteraceae bacterium]
MESQTVEYKQQWDDKYLRYISGFANAQGGTLLIGVDDRGEVTGLPNVAYLLEAIPNKAVQATGIAPAVEIQTKDGKEYISIYIQASEQPVSCHGKFYLRSGSTLQELNGMALSDFLLKRSHRTYDMHVEEAATMNDISEKAVRYFVERAIEAKRLGVSARQESKETILRKLGLVNEQGQLTFAALMLFSDRMDYYCPTAIYRIGRFGASQADLIFDDNIACPLVMMPEKVMQTLRSRYLVPIMQFEGLNRKEPLEIPEEALREIICNAIIHKDYRSTFIQMRVWANKIELWNPGKLPEGYTVETLMQPHESIQRNELIAKVFFLAGFIENWGRGYEKIKDGFEKEDLQIPHFEQLHGGFMTTILRERFIALNGQSTQVSGGVNEKINGGVNGGVIEMQLTERQKIIVALIKSNVAKNGGVNSNSLAEIMKLGKRTLERELSLLRKANIIHRVGSDKTGHWEVVE